MNYMWTCNFQWLLHFGREEMYRFPAVSDCINHRSPNHQSAETVVFTCHNSPPEYCPRKFLFKETAVSLQSTQIARRGRCQPMTRDPWENCRSRTVNQSQNSGNRPGQLTRILSPGYARTHKSVGEPSTKRENRHQTPTLSPQIKTGVFSKSVGEAWGGISPGKLW